MAHKRRPGFPRKNEHPDRITLRMEAGLYEQMNDAVGKLGFQSQRELIEAAARRELRRRPRDRPKHQPNVKVSRTGMWIDRDLLARMDARIAEEDSTQRAFLEDAVRHYLEYAAQPAG